MTLLLEPSILQAQPIDDVGYIQNVKQETVVLASNTLQGGEIYSNQEENFSNYYGTTPCVVFNYSKNNLFNKNITHLNGCFIHNLSTNNQKVHPIRAP